MDNQFNLFSPAATSECNTSNAEDSFACCSRFRQCSDAGYCLISDEEYSNGCSYRKNLENGKVFYGKKANSFDRDTYADILQRINRLPAGARSMFDQLVIFFCEYSRGSMFCLIRNEHIKKLSSVGLFSFGKPGSSFPARCGFHVFWKPQLKDSPVFRLAQAYRAAELKPLRDAKKEAKQRGDEEEYKRLEKELKRVEKRIPSEKTEEFCHRWLNAEAPQLRDLYAEPYKLAHRNLNTTQYLEEYYRDTLFSGIESRVYSLSPLAEDKLLAPAVYRDEESRRIQRSHGYSQEEKEKRLAALTEKENHPAENDSSSQKPKSRKKRSTPNPFWGNTFVITGALREMERRTAFIEILLRGGRIADNPVNTMDYLVLGQQEWSEMHNGVASRKIQKAVQLQEEGRDVKIISEDEFYEMLSVLMRDLGYDG